VQVCSTTERAKRLLARTRQRRVRGVLPVRAAAERGLRKLPVAVQVRLHAVRVQRDLQMRGALRELVVQPGDGVRHGVPGHELRAVQQRCDDRAVSQRGDAHAAAAPGTVRELPPGRRVRAGGALRGGLVLQSRVVSARELRSVAPGRRKQVLRPVIRAAVRCRVRLPWGARAMTKSFF
jgi:hypothetical protein